MNKIEKLLALMPRLSGNEFKLLVYLAEDSRDLFSQVGLAKKLGCERQAIQHAVKNLEKNLGVLIVSRGDRNSRQVNRYQIDWIRIENLIGISPVDDTAETVSTESPDENSSGRVSSDVIHDSQVEVASDTVVEHESATDPDNSKLTTPRLGVVESPVEESITVPDTDVDPEDHKKSSLDPEISALIDKLDAEQIQDTTVEYLRSAGVVPSQSGSDQELKIDRDKLLRFLEYWNLNSLTEFMNSVDGFAKKLEHQKSVSVDQDIQDQTEDVAPAPRKIIPIPRGRVETFAGTGQRQRKEIELTDAELDDLMMKDPEAWMRAICTGSPDKREDEDEDGSYPTRSFG